MENTDDKIYSEVYGLIELVSKEYRDLLPNKVIQTIENKRDKNYTPKYNVDIPLEKQGIHKDSLAILSNIQYNYWCKTEQEKNEFLKELKQVDTMREEELRKKYNPDNIFKKNKIERTTEEEVALVEVKTEKWYKKILKLFKKLFRK